jgi:transposase InsO family protein
VLSRWIEPMPQSLDTRLVNAALCMALPQRPRHATLVVNSDRVSQFARVTLPAHPHQRGVVASVAAKARYCDNAFIESFWSGLNTRRFTSSASLLPSRPAAPASIKSKASRRRLTVRSDVQSLL